MCRQFVLILSASILPIAHAHAAEDMPPLRYKVEKESKKNQGNYQLIPGYVETDLEYSKTMFDRQEHVTDKALQQLKARQNGDLKDGTLYLGARYIGSGMYETTNIAGKFPILSRLPSQHMSGKKDTKWVTNDASLNATLTLPYLTGFVQLEYTDVEYPGQDQTQWRKYYVTLGDLKEFPIYATFGKKTVAFGDFTSYAPFTHNHSSHYFWAQTKKNLLEVGYVKDGTHIAASLIENHRGNRVISSPKNDGNFENFAINATHEMVLGPDTSAKIGAGFLRGTIYDSSISYHPPSTGANDKRWDSAWNAHGEMTYKKVDVMGEFTTTVDKWPATDYKVSTLTAQARYNDEVMNRPAVYSAMYSKGRQGASGTEWEKMDQAVLGAEIELIPHIKIGIEYLYNKGFVPLILPKITSDKEVESHTFIIGAEITF